MDIAVLLFPRLTVLDAVGPYEVLSRVPGAQVRFVAARPGPQRSDTGALALVADHALADAPAPDVVVVPGGPGTRALLADAETLDWLRGVHRTSRWTASVCTGSLLLGAAGILRGLRATCHWRSLPRLAEFGAEPVSQRVVVDGKVITAAGVSSGIDMALRLAALLAGPETAQAIQLGIEYAPEPPFDAGSPATAPPHVVEAVRRAGEAAERRAAEDGVPR
ncbi:MAG TPA: DJ-1/PfpI family protein [Dehalococcoidia bacterium]